MRDEQMCFCSQWSVGTPASKWVSWGCGMTRANCEGTGRWLSGIMTGPYGNEEQDGHKRLKGEGI